MSDSYTMCLMALVANAGNVYSACCHALLLGRIAYAKTLAMGERK